MKKKWFGIIITVQLLTKENTWHGTIINNKNNDNKAIQSWKVNRFWIKRQMKKISRDYESIQKQPQQIRRANSYI